MLLTMQVRVHPAGFAYAAPSYAAPSYAAPSYAAPSYAAPSCFVAYSYPLQCGGVAATTVVTKQVTPSPRRCVPPSRRCRCCWS
jgi:hypothetical protein